MKNNIFIKKGLMNGMADEAIRANITISKSGTICMCEKGGGFKVTGYATLIGDKYGNPKKPICVKRHGDLACKEHAVIPVREGDTVIMLFKTAKNRYEYQFYRVFEFYEDYAVLKVDEYVSLDMLQMAIRKANTYHCRFPMYIIEEGKTIDLQTELN